VIVLSGLADRSLLLLFKKKISPKTYGLHCVFSFLLLLLDTICQVAMYLNISITDWVLRVQISSTCYVFNSVLLLFGFSRPPKAKFKYYSEKASYYTTGHSESASNTYLSVRILLQDKFLKILISLMSFMGILNSIMILYSTS